jgi:hypothetical protein
LFLLTPPPLRLVHGQRRNRTPAMLTFCHGEDGARPDIEWLPRPGPCVRRLSRVLPVYAKDALLRDERSRSGESLLLFEIAVAFSAVLDTCVCYPYDGGDDEEEDHAESDGGVAVQVSEMMLG